MQRLLRGLRLFSGEIRNARRKKAALNTLLNGITDYLTINSSGIRTRTPAVNLGQLLRIAGRKARGIFRTDAAGFLGARTEALRALKRLKGGLQL